MYIHLGENYTVRSTEVVAVLNLDNVSLDKKSKNFISMNKKNDKIVYVTRELPKTAVVCKDKIYICQVAAAIIEKRVRNRNVKKYYFD